MGDEGEEKKDEGADTGSEAGTGESTAVNEHAGDDAEHLNTTNEAHTETGGEKVDEGSEEDEEA